MNETQGLILLVDDEDGIRRLLKHKLTNLGYRCMEAVNGQEALNTLESNIVDLVIMDVKMPVKNGLETLPEIRTRFPYTSVIMATAVGEINTVIECMKLGAYDYMTKPFDLTEVGMSVNRALEKRRLELALKDYHEHLQQKVDEQAQKIRKSYLNAVTALAFALEAKDKYTSGHSERVASISVAIGKELALPDVFIERMRIAGWIHDIGKIGIPEAILNKPGRLTPEEFLLVKSHCEIGERILRPIVEDDDVLSIVKHHHERYDGKGYPDGLAGEKIPIGARVLAVADTYDAMTSERPYRKAMEISIVTTELERNKGSQFDPAFADALIRIRMANNLNIDPIISK
jgi:putative two-component system response regulator